MAPQRSHQCNDLWCSGRAEQQSKGMVHSRRLISQLEGGVVFGWWLRRAASNAQRLTCNSGIRASAGPECVSRLIQIWRAAAASMWEGPLERLRRKLPVAEPAWL